MLALCKDPCVYPLADVDIDKGHLSFKIEFLESSFDLGNFLLRNGTKLRLTDTVSEEDKSLWHAVVHLVELL